MKKIIAICLFIFISTTTYAKTFADKPFVTYGQLLKEIEKVAQSHEESSIIQKEFKALQKSHGINDNLYHDFVRVRLAFEATRDSGLWHIRWAVTDKEPNSDEIWAQLTKQKKLHYQTEEQSKATATAECDELSALFSIIARGLGVKEVGLFWPTYNHTVAVWKAKDTSGKPVRIVVPTSQVFLPNNAGLGTRLFNFKHQKTIYNYSRKDIKVGDKIPAAVAEMMIEQIKQYGTKSATWLQKRRNRLSKKIGGS